ncbi:MAG TPA: glycosyltransferase family 4 protein [Rhodothermales bacterium]
MRTLFWCEQFWPNIGGAELFAGRLILALQDRGHEFAVVTRRDSPDLPSRESYHGIPIHRLPFWTAAAGRDAERLLEVRREVAELKRSLQPDLVHLNGFAPTSAMFHRLTSAIHPAPLLLTLHAIAAWSEATSDSLLEHTLREAAHVVGCSEAIVRRARFLAPGVTGRSTVIRHGLETPSVPPAALPVDDPRILCLGRLSHVKGFDVAFRAFASIARRFPRSRLVIAGDGEQRATLEQLASELKIRELVDFLGWIAPEDVPSVINTASLVVAPSRTEGFGLAALEAALMARPVVASDVDGLPEVVRHEETGILVPPDDPVALAGALERLLLDPDGSRRMGSAARSRALAEFRWGDCVDAYDALYRGLIAGGAGNAHPQRSAAGTRTAAEE